MSCLFDIDAFELTIICKGSFVFEATLLICYVAEEEDKENKTPPPRDISAANVNGDIDWVPKTKEREERDFLLAVENSLRDQVCNCSA